MSLMWYCLFWFVTVCVEFALVVTPGPAPLYGRSLIFILTAMKVLHLRSKRKKEIPLTVRLPTPQSPLPRFSSSVGCHSRSWGWYLRPQTRRRELSRGREGGEGDNIASSRSLMHTQNQSYLLRSYTRDSRNLGI